MFNEQHMIENIRYLSNDYIFIILSEIPSIITEKNSETKLPMENYGNSLKFTYSGDEGVAIVRFPYDKHYKAYYMNDEKKIYCDVKKNKDGYVEISNMPNNTDITLEYFDMASVLTIISSVVTFVLLMITLLLFIKEQSIKKKQSL